jgi:hypothetical protein
MLKKVTIVAVALVLLLSVAPLVLAQDAGQQGVGSDQYLQAAQAAAPTLVDLASLDSNNNLIISCNALSARVDQLAQSGFTLANSPDLRLVMSQVENLSQLCLAEGFTPPA